jgi:hypothetical protein
MLAQHLSMGILMAKIEYWRRKYYLLFQFDKEYVNVFISHGAIDLAEIGGYGRIEELLKDTIEWCEKANPSFKYPDGIEITNPYTGT